jgi:hypothetical protein
MFEAILPINIKIYKSNMMTISIVVLSLAYTHQQVKNKSMKTIQKSVKGLWKNDDMWHNVGTPYLGWTQHNRKIVVVVVVLVRKMDKQACHHNLHVHSLKTLR